MRAKTAGLYEQQKGCLKAVTGAGFSFSFPFPPSSPLHCFCFNLSSDCMQWVRWSSKQQGKEEEWWSIGRTKLRVERREERKKWMMREEENRKTKIKGDRKKETMWLFWGIFGENSPSPSFLTQRASVEQCIMCSCKWVSKITSDWLRAPTLFWGNMYA